MQPTSMLLRGGCSTGRVAAGWLQGWRWAVITSQGVNPPCTFASSTAVGPEEQLGGEAGEGRGLEERFSEDEFQPDKWAPPEAQVGGACGPLPTTILRAGEAKEGRELDTETRGLEERFSEDEYSR